MRQYLPAVAALILLALPCPTLRGAEVELTTGEVLKGNVVEQTDENVVLEHPVLGTIPVPRASVAALRGVEPPADPAVEEVAEQEPIVEEPKGFWLSLWDGWESEFVVSVSGATGNTEELNLRIGFRTERENERKQSWIDSAYYYSESSGTATDNDFYLEGYHEWKIQETKWSIFIDGRYDFDEFNTFQHRVAGHAGAAYRWIERDNLNVKLLAGIGAVAEFESPNTGLRPEVLLGVDLDWTIAENQTVTASTRFYPDLEDSGEFRTLSKAEWKMDIDYAKSLALVVGMSHEYNSVVAAGVDKSDFKYYGGLALSF